MADITLEYPVESNSGYWLKNGAMLKAGTQLVSTYLHLI